MVAPVVTPHSSIKDILALKGRVEKIAKSLVSATAHNVQVRRINAVQTIPTGAATAITWDTTDFLSPIYTVSFAAAFAGGITVAHNGWIKISGSSEFGTNATGFRYMSVFKNGVEVPNYTRSEIAVNATTGATTLIMQPRAYAAVVGDQFTLGVVQNSGVSINLSANAIMLAELLPN